MIYCSDDKNDFDVFTKLIQKMFSSVFFQNGRGYYHRLGQTKDYAISIYCFSAKYT